MGDAGRYMRAEGDMNDLFKMQKVFSNEMNERFKY